MIEKENGVLRDADAIITAAIGAVLPDAAVRRALSNRAFAKPVTVFSVGKAAWRMASAAREALGAAFARGLVVTKTGHSEGALDGFDIIEAGHPVPDAQSLIAGERALALARGLGEEDEALLLLSGGGSALLECLPQGVSLDDLKDLTGQMMRCAADIREINCVRKHLSRIKGGRLAEAVAPARLFCIVVSDVIGDPLDVIASGPAHPDTSTCRDALAVCAKYRLRLTDRMRDCLANEETPKALTRVETVITGNVTELCAAAAAAANALGYAAQIVDTALEAEARDVGRMIAARARDAAPPCALVYGGETVVHVRGKGKGGRNQEVALSAAEGIAGMPDTCVFAVGSDGTDGPTDAAGGMVTGEYYAAAGADNIARHLADNDAYPLLKETGALIFTGPTGTNVNDLYVLLRK